MVHLKLVVLFVISPFFALSDANLASTDPFSCLGPDIAPSEFYQAKIDKSMEFFSEEPKVQPEFFVRQTGKLCHNAWADTLRNNKVIISEPVLRDFDQKDLAGIIAHEIAHLEFPKENEHWKTDLRGTELTSIDIMLHELNTMLSDCIDLKKIEGLAYSILYNLDWDIEDHIFRINKIKSYYSTESPE